MSARSLISETIQSELLNVRPHLWRFCLTLTQNRTDAEDLFQNTCLRVLEKKHQFEPGSRFDKWVFRIAYTQFLNELRRLKKQRSVSFAEDGYTDGNTRASARPDPEPNVRSLKPGPFGSAYHNEIIDTVMKLPEGQRAAVLLTYVAGFTYSESAEIMNVPVGTVMSRLATARKQLARRIGSNADSAHLIESGV